MDEAVLAELERRIQRLSVAEQRRLLDRLALRLGAVGTAPTGLDPELARMAADPEIQRELREIEQEFSGTEMDGLEPG